MEKCELAINPFSYSQVGHFSTSNADLVIYKVPNPQGNLQQFMEKVQEEIKANEPTFHLIELTTDYKLDAFPAFKFIYETGVPSITSTNSTNRNMIIGSIVDGRSVLVYFNNVNEIKLLADANKMIDSIKLNAYNPNQRTEVCVYDNPALGIHFQYLPEDWHVSDYSAKKGWIYINSKTRSSISIHVDNSSNTNPPLADYLSGTTNYYKKTYGANFTLLGSNINSLLAANPAYMMLFNINNDNVREKSLQIGTIKNGVVYSIQFTTYDTDYADTLPKAQRVIDSFEITS